MPHNLTDVATFTDPVAVPSDSDPADAASVETPFQALANRTRLLADRTGGETGAAEFLYDTGKVRFKTLSLDRAIFPPDGTDAPLWRPVLLNNVIHARPLASDVFALLHLELPHGATLQEIEIWVSASGVRAGALRWQASLWRQLMDDTAPYAENAGVQQGSTSDDGGANGYTKFLLTHSLAIDRQNYQYVLRIKGPDTPTSDDWLHIARARFDHTGPGPFGG